MRRSSFKKLNNETESIDISLSRDISSQYDNVKIVADDIDNVVTVAESIELLQAVQDSLEDLAPITTQIVPNIAEILQADDNATTATAMAITATTQADLANAARVVAETKATEAGLSAIAADASADSAEASATTATTQATIATTKANEASASATTATTKASEASVSAGAARDSELAAAAMLDEFDDRYLGSHITDPTLDNDGQPILDGTLYFNTVENVLKVYDIGTAAWYTIPQTLLSSLLDVQLTSVATGDLLKWDGAKWVNTSSVQEHITDMNNPHSVTKAQVGLENVDNTADVDKNVLSATKWTTARTITLDGDVVGSVSVDGSADVTITTTVQPNSIELGTDTTGNYMVNVTAGSGISVSHMQDEGSTATITNSAPNVTTDITTTHTPIDVVVNSSDGTDGTINSATQTLAGVMSAADKTKLDGIEVGATADQTASEIKSLYESNLDTNVYTDAEKLKLSLVADGAEVNVNADWSAVTGDAAILNKPTTISGYGITDAYTKIEVDSIAAAQNEASEIGYSNVTSGLVAVNVQAAVDEVEDRLDTAESKLVGIESGATADQIASEVPVTPVGNLVATDVQDALVELQGDIDNRYTKAETDTLLAGKVDKTMYTGSNLDRADKILANQNIANMLYDNEGNLVKIRYKTNTDTDYEVLSYTNNSLTSIDHYVSSVLKGTTTLSYTSGNLVSAIFVGV